MWDAELRRGQQLGHDAARALLKRGIPTTRAFSSHVKERVDTLVGSRYVVQPDDPSKGAWVLRVNSYPSTELLLTEEGGLSRFFRVEISGTAKLGLRSEDRGVCICDTCSVEGRWPFSKCPAASDCGHPYHYTIPRQDSDSAMTFHCGGSVEEILTFGIEVLVEEFTRNL